MHQDIRMHLMAEFAAAHSPCHEDAAGPPSSDIDLEERESSAAAGMDEFLLKLSDVPTPSTP